MKHIVSQIGSRHLRKKIKLIAVSTPLCTRYTAFQVLNKSRLQCRVTHVLTSTLSFILSFLHHFTPYFLLTASKFCAQWYEIFTIKDPLVCLFPSCLPQGGQLLFLCPSSVMFFLHRGPKNSVVSQQCIENSEMVMAIYSLLFRILWDTSDMSLCHQEGIIQKD